MSDDTEAKAKAKEERRLEQKACAEYAAEHWLEASYRMTSQHHDQAPRPDMS